MVVESQHFEVSNGYVMMTTHGGHFCLLRTAVFMSQRGGHVSIPTENMFAKCRENQTDFYRPKTQDHIANGYSKLWSVLQGLKFNHLKTLRDIALNPCLIKYGHEVRNTCKRITNKCLGKKCKHRAHWQAGLSRCSVDKASMQLEIDERRSATYLPSLDSTEDGQYSKRYTGHSGSALFVTR
ncbi:unnamed protein product [Dicrocoelium dendriticum]|nr:unnamed protein product [Dicrocoelium dendriticum]